MRQPSKMVARVELDKANGELHLYRMALQYVERDKPVASETVRESRTSDCRYRLDLYAPTGASGGLVVSRFVCAGQKDSITPYWLDDMRGIWAEDYTEAGSAFRVAIERLTVARNRAWESAA